MMRAFVADASVAIGWIHPGQATRETDAMLNAIADRATLEVPALWPLEVAHALLMPRLSVIMAKPDGFAGFASASIRR